MQMCCTRNSQKNMTTQQLCSRRVGVGGEEDFGILAAWRLGLVSVEQAAVGALGICPFAAPFLAHRRKRPDRTLATPPSPSM